MPFQPPASLFQEIVNAANATLTFVVVTEGGTTDPETGNYTPNTTTETVRAYCRQTTRGNSSGIGKNQKIVSIEGWFVDPNEPTVTMQDSSQITAVIDGLGQGKLEFSGKIQNAFMREAIANGTWGYKFSGKFTGDN